MPTAYPVLPTTIIRDTPLADWMQREFGIVEVLIASETFQRTGSFKFRAAWNVVNNVSASHLIAASSGNFGQALACACMLTGRRCTIVMPGKSAEVKIRAVEGYGGEVDRIDTTCISRADRVHELAGQFPDAYIASAYDDPFVIEGNASLGRELAVLDPAPDVIVAPVGGGGLTAGLILGLQEAESAIRMVGAEPALANDAVRSLAAGRIVRNESEPQTLADGARTVSLGERNWAILKDGIDSIVEASDAHIEEAVRLLLWQANLKAEPTGALAVAAVLSQPGRFRGKRICCVVSGGNVDPAVFERIIA